MRDKRKEKKTGDSALDESDLQQTLEQERKKYEEIMSRIDNYKSDKQDKQETCAVVRNANRGEI